MESGGRVVEVEVIKAGCLPRQACYCTVLYEDNIMADDESGSWLRRNHK